MPSPIVTWRKQDNTGSFDSWPIGTVDAGTVSAEKSFLVWNNYSGGTNVSDMQNCTITTKDNLGGDTGEVVINKWIEAKVVSLSEGSFTPIGKLAPKTIRTNGSTTNGGGTFTPNVNPHAGDGTSYDILGVINDGTKVNAAGNFVEITTRANVPSNAGAGTTNFKLRVYYQYV